MKKIILVAGDTCKTICKSEFETEAEVRAYFKGAEDAYGYGEYMAMEVQDFNDVFDLLEEISSLGYGDDMKEIYEEMKDEHPELQFAYITWADEEKAVEEWFTVFDGAVYKGGNYLSSNYMRYFDSVIYIEARDKELDEKQKNFFLAEELYKYNENSKSFEYELGLGEKYNEEECLIFRHGKMAKRVPNKVLREAMGSTYDLSEMDFKKKYYETAKKYTPELI